MRGGKFSGAGGCPGCKLHSLRRGRAVPKAGRSSPPGAGVLRSVFTTRNPPALPRQRQRRDRTRGQEAGCKNQDVFTQQRGAVHPVSIWGERRTVSGSRTSRTLRPRARGGGGGATRGDPNASAGVPWGHGPAGAPPLLLPGALRGPGGSACGTPRPAWHTEKGRAPAVTVMSVFAGTPASPVKRGTSRT